MHTPNVAVNIMQAGSRRALWLLHAENY